MEPLPASYYGKIDKKNPVISAFVGEIKEFKSCIKRVRDFPKFDQTTYVRGSKLLFGIWNKYKPRLPTYYYDQHVLHIADFLFSNKLYYLAQWQGYGRYLCEHGDVTIDSIKDVDHFKSTLFPQGLNTDQAKLTFQALQGQCQCMFYLERARGREPSLDSVQKLLSLLGFLRIMMQALLPQEKLCWLVYNGSLYIYDICRYLMSVSRSSQALEFLLWACVCLETSIPLLSPRFLAWRSTLYCAVCQCYYEAQAGVHAEVFARRALGKVSDLANLESPDDSPMSTEDQKAFKEATIKLAIMVFKRSVYEPRRKPKSLFRPKTKNCLRDASTMPWPRNHTERILVELFEGNAAQFLAVLEALWDSTRRPLQTGGLDEPDLMDVAMELMAAGISLLSGVGGSIEMHRNDDLPLCLNGISPDRDLLHVAVAGENPISVDAAVKFVKLLFRYEQWDMFKSLSGSLLSVLASLKGPEVRKAEVGLTLLSLVDDLLAVQRSKHMHKDTGTDDGSERERPLGVMGLTQGFMELVEALHSSVCEPKEGVEPDGDLVMDLILFLWNKCKLAFQRAQVRHWHPAHYLGKMESQDKWVKALFLLNEVAQAFELAAIDPVAVAEMTLRLALVLESSAENALQSGRPAVTPQESSTESTPVEKDSAAFSPVKFPGEQQLQLLYEVLKRGFEAICDGITRLLPCDGSAVCDMAFMQWLGDSARGAPRGEEPEGGVKSPTFTLSMDLQVELLAFLHRAAIKLALHTGQPESVVVEGIKKNHVSRALFLMQKALLQYRSSQSCTKKLLEEALSLVEKAEAEEKRLYLSCAAGKRKPGAEEGSRGPPSPILLSRNNHSLTFMPAPYSLEKQVCWYQIGGREVDGINLKVRVGDCHLLGTGVMIPAKGERLFHIEGLEHNQKYIFAVAAYDAQGKMVGQSIGDSTKPILASAPLSLLMTWSHLAQAAYQTGQQAVAKRACAQLWGHFTRPPPPENTPLSPQTPQPEGLAQTRLCVELLHLTSPLLHQFFLTSIFMQTEIHIQEGALFCDSLCDNGLPIWGQKARLAECERMLVALDLALWLNDSGAALQVVVGCYGLLAPLIYHQIPSEDVLQILIKCLMVLQEISGTVKKKRNVETAESLQHMVACMTYYVVKGLRLQKETRMADMMVEQGKKLLMEIADRSPGGEDSRKAAGHHGDEELNETLKSLDSMKLRKSAPLIAHEATWSKGLGSHDLTGHEDPVILYTVIETQAVRSSFRDVMRFKRKPGFMEFVVLVLQKAMQEDQLDMVVQSGQEALHFLGRRDEELLMKKAQIVMISETRKPSVTPGDQFKRKKPINDKKEEMLLKKRLFALKNQKSEKECKVVDNLIQHMTLLVKRQQHRRRLRLVCSEEWVWRCHVNLLTARANFILLHRNVSQQGSTRQLCYSQLPSSLFSLPRCGTLVCWRSGLQHIRTPDPCVPTAAAARTAAQQPAATRGSPRGPSHSNRDRTSGSYGEDLYSDESDPDHEQDAHRRDALSGLKQRIPQQVMLSKAALHLRRAIVLAHRGGHWTSLQTACAVLWNQACTLPMLLVPPPADCLGVEQVYSSLTPVLAVACELLMDMIDRLKLWRVYDEEEQDLGASLHFSSTLDDCTRVDLRWIKTMVLHTLELLYYQAKWETLAHLALTYNFYTRERYTQMVTPLLVYAQRRLQDRIALFGGPPSPQPHHIQTTEITGESINCRNYVGKQVTCVWRTRLRFKRTSKDTSEIPQMKRAMALVSVPLDVEDTLCCFRDSLERGSHTLLAFQHSHTLLMLLLAHTQPCLEVPFSKDAGAHTPGRVEFSGMVYTPPTIAPPDLSNEDFSALSSICACPLPPSQMQTVLSSLNSSAKHLQAGNLSSLRAQTLHDLGNLHYYKGSRRSARSFWAKALDCALQGSGVLEAWDGVSWQGLSPQQVLKQAGLWGCLQGAVLTAKIAQYILTSDVSQRTKCCLLSAYLFKSLLQASLPHPQANLQYSSYTVVGDLIPGLDLFADPQRGGLSATVSSLGFLCHWLYAAGHYVTVLPVLCLYLHLVGRVCKDPHLTVRARILKVRTLTELGMFSQALREVRRLVNADDVPLPHTYNSTGDTARMKTKFQSNKPITEPANLQSVDALLSSRESSDTSALYGPLLCQWLVLARVQLLLALCERIHTLPDPLGTVPQERETTRRSSDQTTRRSSDQTTSDQATRQSSETEDGQKSPLLGLKKPSPGKVKALLLREACTMLDPVLRSGQAPPTGPEDMELVVEAGLLQSALYLQQGKVSDSADQAVCILRLLQDSVVFQAVSHSSLSPGPRSSMLRLRDSRQNADERDSKSPPQLFDVPTAVEARERMGPSLWLRCRLAAVRSLVAHLPDAAILPGVLPDAAILPGVLPDAAILPGVLTDAAILPGVLPDAAILPGVLPDAAILPGVLPDAAILPGVDSGEEAECVLKEGLQEAEQWGCVETHAALLLLGVRLDTHRARPREYSTVLLQEAVSLLSGRGCVSLGGCVTLARATLLLSDLRGSGGQALLLLTQRLLLQQLTQLGESVDLGEGGRVVLPAAPGLSNTHHPQLVLLASTTFRLGHCLLREASVKPAETGGNAGQPPHQRALEVLQSALHLCQALGSRPRQLEADILYCMGLAERSLLSQSDLTAHAVAKTFLRSINICMDHCPNLQHVQRCYLEMAGVYLKQREERTPDPGQSLSAPNTPKPKTPDAQNTTTASSASQKAPGFQDPNRILTEEEIYLLFSWVCLRAAQKTREASANCALLSGTLCASGDDLPVLSYSDLPDFVSNDLLKPCGGLDVMNRDSPPVSMETDASQSQGGRQLTWVHLAHYHTHLTHLLSLSTCPVVSEVYGGLVSLAEDAGLSLRLSQLQAFFSAHLLLYRDTCTGPQPPTNLLLHPQLLQCKEPQSCPDLDPGASAAKAELVIQWHRPALDPSVTTQNQGQILMYYGLNQTPLSAGTPLVTAVEELRVGQRLVCLEKLRAVHAQLSAACADLNEPAAAPSTTPTPTPTPKKKRPMKADTANCPKQQMLLEKTRLCCTEIRRLLHPQSKSGRLSAVGVRGHIGSSPMAEVPFEVSLQTLRELELCFNPVQGAALANKALVKWLLSLLAPAEGI